jgi:hypothetical protein
MRIIAPMMILIMMTSTLAGCTGGDPDGGGNDEIDMDILNQLIDDNLQDFINNTTITVENHYHNNTTITNDNTDNSVSYVNGSGSGQNYASIMHMFTYIWDYEDLGYDPINHLIIDSDTNSSFVYAYGYNGQVVEINPTCSDLLYSNLEASRDHSGNVADYDYWKEYLVNNFGYSSQLEDVSSQINNDFVSLYYSTDSGGNANNSWMINTIYEQQCTSSTQNYGKNTVLFEIEIPEEQSIRLLSLDQNVILNLHCEDGYSTNLPYTELLDYIGGQSECTLVGTSNVAWSLVVNHTLNDSWGGGDRYYDFGGSYITYSPGANTYSSVYYESYPVIIDVNSQ